MSFSSMPIGDMGGPQMYGGPAGQPILGGGGIAGQTQEQINNPIYGAGSPFQPPAEMTTQPMSSFEGMDGGGSFGKGMGGMIPGPLGLASQQMMGGLFGGGGQMYGGPAGQPILGGTPMEGGMIPGLMGQSGIMGQVGPMIGQATQQLANKVGLPNRAMPTRAPRNPVPQSTYGRVSNNKPQQPLYRGGIRQPPNNYRPPLRGMR